MLFTQGTIVGRDTVAIIDIGSGRLLVDQIPHGQSMALGGTKHQCLLALVNHVHEQVHSVCFAFLDFDEAVEVGLGVFAPHLNFTFLHVIVGRVHILINGGMDFLQSEWTQKTVIDARLEGILIHGLTEVSISVAIDIALGRSR